jgi:hypothetical protein
LRQLAYSGGMMAYLWAEKVLLKDFAEHAETLTRRVKQASEDLARRTARPVHFLPSSGTSKEEMARKIAREDGIEEGLVCVLIVTARPGAWNCCRVSASAFISTTTISTRCSAS